MTPVISIRQLNHTFGEGTLRKLVLNSIDLDIHAGEIVLLMGPSGSGKTTLLTLIGGLRSLQEGSLTVLGQTLHDSSATALRQVRSQIGFIFQSHNLLRCLTAWENVSMPLKLHHCLSAQDRKQRSHAMLDQVEMGHRADYYPDSLSGGQKQRVAISRALVNHPKLILADEPTAALDGKSGRDVMALLQQLAKQQGCTILIVTHDNRILDVADRIITMEDGYLRG
ncbi:MAG: ATP-binding cassette domain-containing protein [Cyanobacteria bacterium J06638_22]